MLTQAQLQLLFHYDPNTGVFTREINHGKSKKGSTPTGLSPGGYLRISIKNRYYMAHRLAWLYVNGEWPNSIIDHINCNKLDNRLCNLREANRSQNAMNVYIYKNNISSFKGVGFHKATGKFRARCQANKKRVFIGYFDTAEEANEAYKAFANTHHGDYCYKP